MMCHPSLPSITYCTASPPGFESVFAITERDGKSYWTKVGVAFTNRDASVTVQLDALPVSGRLQIRAEEDRSERNGR